MSQFDVYKNPDKGSQQRIPYVVVLQSDLLDAIDNHIVAPLRRKQDNAIVPVLRLNPIVMIDGVEFLVRMQDIATVPQRMLKERVTNLTAQRDEILAALDFLFTGF
jgi:toxin CcdB